MPEHPNMTPIDDVPAWTDADEAFLRGALSSLREDLDPQAMPEPAFIRARVRRERRTSRRTWTVAAVAAAAAIAAAVVWNPLAGRDGSRPVPGTPSVTRSSTVTSATPDRAAQLLSASSATLPTAAEWEYFLGLPTRPEILEAAREGVTDLCNLSGVGRFAAQLTIADDMTLTEQTYRGIQRSYELASAATARTAWSSLVRQITECATTTMTRVGSGPLDGSVPLAWSTTIGGRQQIVVLATVGASITYLEVGNLTRATGTPDPLGLGRQAQARLERYASGAPATTDVTDAGVQVHRIGGSTVAASTFLSLAEWSASPAGSPASVVSFIPDEVGDSSIVLCDPVQDVGPASLTYVQPADAIHLVNGIQRIMTTNVASDGSTNAGEPAAMIQGFLDKRTCADGADGTITVTRGPIADSVKVALELPDGVRFTTYVGVTTMATPEHTTTIAIRGFTDDASGWAELERLMTLAKAH